MAIDYDDYLYFHDFETETNLTNLDATTPDRGFTGYRYGSASNHWLIDNASSPKAIAGQNSGSEAFQADPSFLDPAGGFEIVVDLFRSQDNTNADFAFGS